MRQERQSANAGVPVRQENRRDEISRSGEHGKDQPHGRPMRSATGSKAMQALKCGSERPWFRLSRSASAASRDACVDTRSIAILQRPRPSKSLAVISVLSSRLSLVFSPLA